MVQGNSLVDQSRQSEQISLQQLQLAELQKISSKLSAAGSTINTTQSVGGTTANSVAGTATLPSNMTTIPDNQQVQGLQGTQNSFNQMAASGALALKSGVNNISNAASVGRASLERSVGYIEKIQSSPFFAYKNIDWTRTNQEQAEYIQMQSNHRLQNAGLKFGTALGNMGMASLGGAVGSLGGPIGTIAGTVVGSAIGSIGGDEIMKNIKVQQGYEGWLQQNSGRFINMFESNDGLGDGFNEEENKQLSKVLSKMNTKYFMSDDELFTMLNDVTDAGLMKSASDISDFEKKFSGLVESVKKGAKMLNTSYEEMVELYGEWNKMGIKTDAERAELTSQIKTLTSITGLSEGDAANTLTALISNLTNGTTLDAADASNIAQTDLAMASTAREKNLWSEESARLVENLYGSDDSKLAASMTSSVKNAYGTEELKSSLVAAMKLDDSGKVVVDKDELSNIITGLQNGTESIDTIMSKGGEKLQTGELGQSFAHQYTTMTGDQFYQMALEGGGAAGTSQFMTSLLQSAANKNPNLDMNSLMVNMGIASDTNQAQLLTEWSGLYANYGDAMSADVQNQNIANLIRNDASSEFGVSLTQRIKNGWESGWQNIASGVSSINPSLGQLGDKLKDWWTDTDSALRNGYSSSKKTDIAQEEYKDVFKDIASSSSKLKDEFKIDLKSDLSKKDETGGITSKVDSFLNVITSPSKWNTAIKGLFGKEDVEYSNTELSHDGTSVKNLLKKVNKSKTMTDEEKEAMINNINQATGQTQDLVASSLDVVTALGGRDAREKMLDTINVDTATQIKTGAKNFDDFTNEKVLSKLSLEDQKKIQELAVDQATKQIQSKYGNNLDSLASLVESKGYANGNEKVQKILEGGITKDEVKSLVKELMTATQGGSGESEVEQALGAITKDTAKNTKNANKNLEKVNNNMEEMSEKLETFTDTVNKAVKNLESRTNQLERTMNKY